MAAALLFSGAAAVVLGASLLAHDLFPAGRAPLETATLPQPDLTTYQPRAQASALDKPVDGVAFTMRVPAIGYTATVLEGVDAGVLERGPGHYPATAWPGQDGNIGVAGHNSYWLDFARLHPGDRVEVSSRRGAFVYELIGSEVTGPDDRTVLAPTSKHELTLTTCYPLTAGAFATERLIFFARQVEPRPGQAASGSG